MENFLWEKRGRLFNDSLEQWSEWDDDDVEQVEKALNAFLTCHSSIVIRSQQRVPPRLYRLTCVFNFFSQAFYSECRVWMEVKVKGRRTSFWSYCRWSWLLHKKHGFPLLFFSIRKESVNTLLPVLCAGRRAYLRIINLFVICFGDELCWVRAL